MIKTIKNLSSKFLILIIALSFAVWGIGDIFMPNSNNPTIAKVGNSEIKLNEFQLDYQLIIDRLRQSSDQPITDDLLKALGLHQNVIDNLITKKYLASLSKGLQINISENYVKKAIVNNPLFNDQLGVFNKDYFNFYLNRNNLKENDIYRITKEALGNDLIVQSITHSEFIPQKLAANLLKNRDTVRNAKIFTFNTSSMIISNANYSDERIREKYDKEKNNFLDPETRDIKLVTFLYNSEKNNTKISDKEIETFYNENKNLYKTQETRDFYTVQFKTKNEIEEFIKSYTNQNDFLDSLKKYDKKEENSFMENIKRADLDQKSADIIFNLDINQTSEIVKTSFGFKVFLLKNINRSKESSFIEMKEKIKLDIILEKTNEKLYNSANTFYERFLQSRNFDNSLENLKVDIKEFTSVGLKNINNIDILKSLGLDESKISAVIFNLKKNDISEVIEDENNNLHYIYLSNINSAKVKNLNLVREQIVNLLYDEERDKKAKDLAIEFKNNFKIKNYQNNYKNKFFNLKVTEWVTLDDRLGSEIPQKIKELIFLNKLNNLSDIIYVGPSEYALVLPLKQSRDELKDTQKNQIDTILLELNNSIESDINNALVNDLSKLYKSDINQKFLDSF